jgi:DNA repair exonuclease SbcCD ATPase subunit
MVEKLKAEISRAIKEKEVFISKLESYRGVEGEVGKLEEMLNDKDRRIENLLQELNNFKEHTAKILELNKLSHTLDLNTLKKKLEETESEKKQEEMSFLALFDSYFNDSTLQETMEEAWSYRSQVIHVILFLTLL